MTDRRQYVLACLSVFAVAVGMRTLTLYWSPLPATLDGFGYAALARDTIAVGRFPLSRFRADNIGFAGLLSIVSMVIDRKPLYVAQPLVSVIGAASCLTAVALVRRAGRNFDWPGREVRLAATLVGFSLAIEGLYLRRTGVADEEVIGLLLIPLLALGFHRTLQTHRPSWGGLTAVFMFAFPLTHTFSTLIAGLVVIGVLAAHLFQVPSSRTGLLGLGLVGGFWSYFGAYYQFAEQTGLLLVPYVGRILSYPGLFVAWVILLVVGIGWFPRTSTRLKRIGFLLVVGGGFAVLVANFFTPIFPETVATPRPLLFLLLLFVIPVILASQSLPLLSQEHSVGVIFLALLAAPIAQIYFSLTAALTPEFFGTVMRTQTFAHFPVFVLAGLATIRCVSPRLSPLTGITGHLSFKTVIVGLFVASVVLTAPIAFINLDTVSYPSTTAESEFATVNFAAAHVDEQWTGGDSITRIGANYYPTRTTVARGPTATWLAGGSSPACPAISQQSWTTTGAHLFPAPPATVSKQTYAAWLARRNLIYAGTGRDSLSITIARTDTEEGCK